jgi:hypothetical protein
LGVLRAFLLKFLKVGDFWRKVAKLGKTWVKLGKSWVVLDRKFHLVYGSAKFDV